MPTYVARSVLISSTQGKQTNQTKQSFVCARDPTTICVQEYTDNQRRVSTKDPIVDRLRSSEKTSIPTEVERNRLRLDFETYGNESQNERERASNERTIKGTYFQ